MNMDTKFSDLGVSLRWVKWKRNAKQNFDLYHACIRIKAVTKAPEFWFYLVLLMMPSLLQNFGAKLNIIVFYFPHFTMCTMLIPSHREAMESN